MLTTKKAVLVIEDYKPEMARGFFNFEGIEIIHDPREINLIWSYNKTPMMHNGDLDEDTRNKYLCIDVPRYHMNSSEDFVTFCHRNGIECGECVGNHKIDTSKEHCFLCHISRYGGKESATEFNRTTEKISDTIIYESKNFYVQIELGAMTKGMLMICPKKHYLSAAQLPDKLFKEYYEVMHHVEWLLKAVYGNEPVIFFEHGSAPSGMSSHKRSIVHAHTHVAWGVPFDKKYLEAVCVRPVKCESVSKDSKCYCPSSRALLISTLTRFFCFIYAIFRASFSRYFSDNFTTEKISCAKMSFVYNYYIPYLKEFINMNFGEKLRTLRKAKNLSQTALAKLIHVSRRTVCSWETENRYPKERHLVTILAEVLDCPVEYLLSEQPGIVSGIYDKFGKDRSYISKNLLLDIEAYFSCDYISQEEKDTLMFAIHESYIKARKSNSNSWKKIRVKYPE